MDQDGNSPMPVVSTVCLRDTGGVCLLQPSSRIEVWISSFVQQNKLAGVDPEALGYCGRRRILLHGVISIRAWLRLRLASVIFMAQVKR